MPKIKLITKINAPQETVFDLARSIDLHKESMAHTNEKAIAGKTSGLIEKGESVTWEAKHFGVKQRLTSKITEFESPNFFVDEMVKGAFHSFRHEHYFKTEKDQTIMTDIFEYKSPLGFFGRIANKIFLKRHMIELLQKRNLEVKEFAESDKWKNVLNTKNELQENS